MNLKQQVSGLNDLLTAIDGVEARLSTWLADLGFEAAQIELLRTHHLETLVAEFLEVLGQKIRQGWDGERRYRIIRRRFGLDGEPPDTLETLAGQLDVSRERVRQLEAKTLVRCRARATRQQLRAGLHRIALRLVAGAAERPDPAGILARLEQLADVRAAAGVTRAEYEARRAEVLQKVQAELDVLEAEYRPLLEASAARTGQLEAAIRNDVLRHGANINGPRLQAVYSSGRGSWDTKGIARYAETHPELMQFKKQGEPTVSIRSSHGKTAFAADPSRSASERSNFAGADG